MRILFATKTFVIEPLGIMYLMSALKKAGHKPDIIQVDEEDINIYIKKFKPDIIAYSLTTGSHSYFQELNRELKRKHYFTSLFGGPHVTFFAEELMQDKAVDIACLGEGEEALVELADAIEKGKKYTKIKNLWVRVAKKIYKNDVRPLQNLDKIEFPERKIIYKKYKSCRLSAIKNIIATRGCPFNCPYCYNHLIKKIYANNGVYVRQRSVDNVLAEMAEIKKNYPIKMFYFQDDIFAVNKTWLKDFSRRYPVEVGTPFHCHLRVNLTDKETISLLHTAGCTSASFAIETGNDKIRNEILGRVMSKEQITDVAEMLHKKNIKFRIFNMIGLPGGSIETDIETLKLNIKCKPTLGWASIYQPYPKTELYQKARNLNLCENIELDKFNNFFDSSVLNIPNKNKVVNLQRLFSLIVSWPILFPVTKFLIKLPFINLYSNINNYWKNHCNDQVYSINEARKE